MRLPFAALGTCRFCGKREVTCIPVVWPSAVSAWVVRSVGPGRCGSGDQGMATDCRATLEPLAQISRETRG